MKKIIMAFVIVMMGAGAANAAREDFSVDKKYDVAYRKIEKTKMLKNIFGENERPFWDAVVQYSHDGRNVLHISYMEMAQTCLQVVDVMAQENNLVDAFGAVIDCSLMARAVFQEVTGLTVEEMEEQAERSEAAAESQNTEYCPAGYEEFC